MSNQNIPPAVREEINQAQQLEEQLQGLNQRLTLTKNTISEIERTLKELDTIEDSAEVYKNIGMVLIHTNKHKMIEDLNEELSVMQVRAKNYQNTVDKTRNAYEDLLKKLRAKLPQQSE